MKNLLTLLLLCGSLALAQTTPVTLNLTVNTTSLQDFEKYRILQYAAVSNEGILTSSLDTISTTLSLSGTCPASGTAVVIDSEPMLVTNQASCTVTRNSAIAGTSAVTHAKGVQVQELKYANATALLKGILNDFMLNTSVILGANSSVVGADQAAILAAQASLVTKQAGKVVQ